MLHNWQKWSIICFSALLICCFAGLSVQAQTTKRCVVIDPAHGGEDSGVIGVDHLAEKDLTLAIALALQNELAKGSDLEIVMTRNSDKTLSTEARREMIAKLKPSIVLSLHVNAGFGKTSSGFELYYPGFKDLEAQRKDAKGRSEQIARNQYLSDTVKLARLIQKNLDGLFPRKGRGLRVAPTPLAEQLTVPVLVVELGFVTNPDEKKKLASDKTQKDIAKALARSVKSFFQESCVQKKFRQKI